MAPRMVCVCVCMCVSVCVKEAADKEMTTDYDTRSSRPHALGAKVSQTRC
jgi:hypothetical protein